MVKAKLVRVTHQTDLLGAYEIGMVKELLDARYLSIWIEIEAVQGRIWEEVVEVT
jgi:hypothetical protein